MQRIILHIGRHKSGTSAIQRFLGENRAAFAEAGIVIPTLGGFDNPEADEADKVAHHLIAMDFGQSKKALPSQQKEWVSAVAQAAEGYDTLVLSSEAFQNASDFTGLRALCNGRYVEVVCYLREYLDYALSAYAQEVKKSGITSNFFEFERGFDPQLARFMTRWEHFANRCHWRLYDRAQLVGGDVVQDFLEVARLPDPGGPRPEQENPRLGGSLLGFKLMANAAGLHSLKLAQTLEPMARTRPEFRAPLPIGPERQSELRAAREYNRVLQDHFGDLKLPSFAEGAWPLGSPRLSEDFGEILSGLDAMPAITNHPLFRQFIGASHDPPL